MSHTNYNAVSNKKVDETPKPAAVAPQVDVTIEPEVTPPAPVPAPAIGTVVDCTKLNVREEPGLFAPIICAIDKGTQVLVMSEESTEDWYKVDIGGQTGFCMKKYMTIEE